MLLGLRHHHVAVEQHVWKVSTEVANHRRAKGNGGHKMAWLIEYIIYTGMGETVRQVVSTMAEIADDGNGAVHGKQGQLKR